MSKHSINIKLLKQAIKDKGLKYTKQREIIFETILNCDSHLNVEELCNAILLKYPKEKIGIATIYRALSFLEEASLIASISIDKKNKKFENNLKDHHDHLICVKCGKIVEFINNTVEKEQEKIAKEQGFSLVSHTMYLYGICRDCE
jgi:Fur family ferric uptake transcriptional regulator